MIHFKAATLREERRSGLVIFAVQDVRVYMCRLCCGSCVMASGALLLDVVVLVLTAAQLRSCKSRTEPASAGCTAQSVQLGTLTHCSVLQQQLQAPCRAVIHHDCSK